MNKYNITIEWDGPFDFQTVITKMNDAGPYPLCEGEDYGLYQIYGKHILCGPDTLLYIGETTKQTFSVRLNQHEKDYKGEENIRIYIGRVYDPEKHSEKDDWKSWEKDVEDAEKILIYKYSPHYNSASIQDAPDLSGRSIRLIHRGSRHKLKAKDYAPQDWQSSSRDNL